MLIFEQLVFVAGFWPLSVRLNAASLFLSPSLPPVDWDANVGMAFSRIGSVCLAPGRMYCGSPLSLHATLTNVDTLNALAIPPCLVPRERFFPSNFVDPFVIMKFGYIFLSAPITEPGILNVTQSVHSSAATGEIVQTKQECVHHLIHIYLTCNFHIIAMFAFACFCSPFDGVVVVAAVGNDMGMHAASVLITIC